MLKWHFWRDDNGNNHFMRERIEIGEACEVVISNLSVVRVTSYIDAARHW